MTHRHGNTNGRGTGNRVSISGIKARQLAAAYLTDEHVGLVEVSPEESGSMSWSVFYLDTYFLSLSGLVELFVVSFNTCHDAQITELQTGKNNSQRGEVKAQCFYILP